MSCDILSVQSEVGRLSHSMSPLKIWNWKLVSNYIKNIIIRVHIITVINVVVIKSSAPCCSKSLRADRISRAVCLLLTRLRQVD